MGRSAILLMTAVVAVLAVLAGLLWLTRPQPLELPGLAAAQADIVNGERMFHAASCAACHEADLRGGVELISSFGTFRAPNVSADMATGIGGWTTAQFVNAMLRGVSPEGQHYYPSFPYTSYARMQLQDVVDLKAYLDTLPPVSHQVADHDLRFPWNVRRGIGLWKLRYLDPEPQRVLAEDADPLLLRGRYLAEGPGHCAECHTLRDRFGGSLRHSWLAGAFSFDGEGKVPNITPHEDGLADWSLRDLEYYFESGFTPEFDMVGGSMVPVQENLARLPAADRAAIAAYLKALPAVADAAVDQ